MTEIHRLGDGRWIKIESLWADPQRLFVWKSDRFVELDYPPTLGRWELEYAVVSAAGDLLILLVGGELWTYEIETDAWRRIWMEPAGGARVAPRR